jgi:hypothetical protein
MRRRDYYWNLYRLSDKKQIADLRTDYVEVIFEVLTDTQQKDWVIWREGLRSWKPLSEFSRLLVELRKAPAPQGIKPPAFDHDHDRNHEESEATQSEGTQLTLSKPGVQVAGPIGLPQAPVTREVSAPSSRQEATTIAAAVARRLSEMEGQGTGVELSLEERSNEDNRESARFSRHFEVRIIVEDKVFANSTENISMSGMKLRDSLPTGLPKYFAVEIVLHDRVVPVVCSIVQKLGAEGRRLRIEVNEYEALLRQALLDGR